MVVDGFLLGGWGLSLPLKLEPRGRWGTSIAFRLTSLVENMRVSLSFMEGFSAGFGRASWDELPLIRDWPFCGVKRGDFLPSDLTEEGLELAAEAVVGLAIAGDAEGMSAQQVCLVGERFVWRGPGGREKGWTGRRRYIRESEPTDDLLLFLFPLVAVVSLGSGYR